ncbi:Ribonuclease P protein component [Sulfobacillus acidophilus DSM 10332]|uniref:Ribonuclease P protein component n=1 Tax=Sulfobacillus acidophilus (strain ATCC 700253 / DSM 10332 / NAL) TaxID=679936 RepID=G8TUZ6_SULAD|nr:Ribonuclease P protein component [Sulfobacillus acidophilus DSM 10332]
MKHPVRLKKRAEFGAVIRRGRRFGDRLLVLFILPQSQAAVRIGFTAQRAVGGAVERNRVKRRLRAAVQEMAEHIGECGDLVVMGKPEVADAPWNEVLGALKRVLRRAGCWKERE